MSDIALSTTKVRDDWWTRAWEWIACWTWAWECFGLGAKRDSLLITRCPTVSNIPMHHTLAVMSRWRHLMLEKNKKGRNQENLLCILYCWVEEKSGLIRRVKVDVKCDILVGVVLCGSRRCCGSLCPKRCGIVLGLHDLWASGDAFPSIWGVVRWWCY